jgi:hypothetical protein
MLPVGFEPTIPASAWPQTYALDSAATGIGIPISARNNSESDMNLPSLICKLKKGGIEESITTTPLQHLNIKKFYVVPTLRLCVLYGSQNKQQLLPYKTLRDWFFYIKQIRFVFKGLIP